MKLLVLALISVLLSLSPACADNLPIKKILFVGNSYTGQNDMPYMVQKILNSNLDKQYGYVTGQIIQGGKKLSDQVKSGEMVEALRQDKYDVVFLQEQSTTLFYSNERPLSAEAFTQLIDEIRKHGAEPVIWSTWPRKPGNEFYQPAGFKNLKTPKDFLDMAFMIDEFSRSISKQTGAAYVPVGGYWAGLMQTSPDLDLYEPDGSHPNVKGSYLAALLIARRLSGSAPQADAWAPAEIDEAQNKILYTALNH